MGDVTEIQEVLYILGFGLFVFIHLLPHFLMTSYQWRFLFSVSKKLHERVLISILFFFFYPPVFYFIWIVNLKEMSRRR